jgi:acetoin:2,6-dichlorophenolindophenol oxidoreductase subunit beta
MLENIKESYMAREMTFVEAVREGFRQALRRDNRVILLGEDVKVGFLGTTRFLVDEFGDKRIIDTPICESAFVNAAIGAAMTGMRPVVELMYSEYLYLAMDQIATHAGSWQYITGGQLRIPLVIEVPYGSRGSGAYSHSQSLEASFLNPAGVKIVCPSTPYDAKGLLKTAIEDDNPVIFFEHRKVLLMKGEVPEEEYSVPIGKASVWREGTDVTILGTSWTTHLSKVASETLEKEGISVEVIDLRTLKPLDKETILSSLKKTGRLVIVEEGRKCGGYGAEIAAIVAEEWIGYLDAPIRRVASLDVPVPFSPSLAPVHRLGQRLL